MIIAVDFDGTIVANCFPDIGSERYGAIEALKRIQQNGNQLILWTCRTDLPERAYLDEAVHFCMSRGLIFDAINCNLPNSPFAGLGDSRKVYADFYIDDKALQPNWQAYTPSAR
jgi:hypothetical protein